MLNHRFLELSPSKKTVDYVERLGRFTCLILLLSSWGFSSHRCIHDAAIQTLPDPLYTFFKSHRSWIVAHAVDADLRKHGVIGEAEKHFIDLDNYGFELDSLVHLFPRNQIEANSIYGDSLVFANGIGPWSAITTYYRLVESFSTKNEQLILRNAVDLGHYVADLHVPLHTTSNYNGAETGQRGIHSLWETQLPEQFIGTYQLTPGIDSKLPAAVYIEDHRNSIWNATFTSHLAVDSVLYFEALISLEMGINATHAYVERGRTQQRMRSKEFVTQYHTALNGQVERRMQQSISTIGNLWYSAWIDAGQPSLQSKTVSGHSWWAKIKQWIIQ